MRAEMATKPRPLLAVHDAKEGYIVYDLRFVSEETLEMSLFPRPVVQPLHYRPLAVFGDAILGVTQAAQPQPRGFADWTDTGPPIMLPVGDATIIRMDTVIHGDNFCCEALRLQPGGRGWRAVPLPRPPVGTSLFPFQKFFITTYFVMGTRVWICVAGKGTFSLDTERGKWQIDFGVELPMEGRALFVPELDSVVGLAAGTQFLTAYRFVGDIGVPDWDGFWREAFPWECIDAGHEPSREMVSMAYLGNGRFCICRPVNILQQTPSGPVRYSVISLLVLEITRLPNGKLQLA